MRFALKFEVAWEDNGSFFSECTFRTTFSEEELWPDRDGPPTPGAADVAEMLRRDGREVTASWIFNGTSLQGISPAIRSAWVETVRVWRDA